MARLQEACRKLDRRHHMQVALMLDELTKLFDSSYFAQNGPPVDDHITAQNEPQVDDASSEESCGSWRKVPELRRDSSCPEVWAF